MAKRIGMFALSFAVAIMMFVAFAPRAVHAITATLVQVVNNSTTPVPTEDTATQFQTGVCTLTGPVSTAANLCGSITNNFVVPTMTTTGVPIRRLIVDNFSGVCSNFNSPGLHIKSVRLFGPFVPDHVANGLGAIANFMPVSEPYGYVNTPDTAPPYPNVPENDYSFGQLTHWAFNPGDTVTMDYFYFAPNAGAPSSNVDIWCTGRVVGHLVTN